MKFKINDGARTDLIDACAYYNSEKPGLGDRFKKDVIQALRAIRAYPTMWPSLSGNLRRHVLRKFPYSVIYILHTDQVEIVAVAHGARRPGYWKERK